MPGQVIDVWPSVRRNLSAARLFFTRALATRAVPIEVTTDRARHYEIAVDQPVRDRLRVVFDELAHAI